ncbi:hypothetical protein BH11BAC6_BH11BAC6_11340 [soil metagenome]
MPDTSTNHEISLQVAIDMTTLYRQNRPVNFPICETFHKAAVVALLENIDAAYMRIYYGMKEDLSVHAILVAADAAEEDLLPQDSSAGSMQNAQQNVILEDGFRCPQYCPPPYSLNT